MAQSNYDNTLNIFFQIKMLFMFILLHEQLFSYAKNVFEYKAEMKY